MFQRTPKDNFLGLHKGIPSEYVCSYSLGMKIPDQFRATTRSVGPNSLMTTPSQLAAMGKPGVEWTNTWGVPYVSNIETGYAGLPKPGVFILDDVTRWDKVVKKPDLDLDSIDFEALAKSDIERAAFDRNETALQSGASFGPFQLLMALMGFTEGLCAMLEEPEAVEELFNFLGDFYEPIQAKTIQYYDPDIVSMGDDTASKYAPFVSVETYKSLLKPSYVRMAKYATDRGLPIVFHNCGRCEDYVEDMVEFGVRYWEPAQTENDLLAIKAKYKEKMTVIGGYDFVPDGPITEEQVRASVRNTMDKYAPGGGYVFCGNIMGPADKADFYAQVSLWVREEVHEYGGAFYLKGANA